MGSQICIQNGETCVDCSEYAAAFSCLPKIKISGMSQISELEIISILDSKCEDILIPISTISCEKSPESYAMSLKQLLDIIGHTSIGERKSFPDKIFTAEGQVEEYELTVFNPSETRDMQISYFAQWSSYSSIRNGLVEIIGRIYIDDEEITIGGSYNTSIGNYNDGNISQDAGSYPIFYTKIIKPKSYTNIKLTLECGLFPNDIENTNPTLVAETIQLMITGVTR